MEFWEDGPMTKAREGLLPWMSAIGLGVALIGLLRLVGDGQANPGVTLLLLLTGVGLFAAGLMRRAARRQRS
jgi:hypothetical protein